MKTLTGGLVVLAAATLVGCNSSDDKGGSGSISLKSPTFNITESNRDSVDSITYNYAGEANATNMLPDVGRSLPAPKILARTGFQPRDIAARFNETETINCSSGSITINVSGSGIDENTGDMSSSGSLKMTFDVADCSESTYDGSFSEDGVIGISMSWAGYDGYDSFDSLSLSFTFNEYVSTSFDGNGSEIARELVHGSMSASLSNDETSMSMGLSLSSSEIDNKIINIETSSAIKQRNSDYYPYTGTLIVSGGNDTKVTYTIVANGVEVSLNGGQAELISWSEMDGY